MTKPVTNASCSFSFSLSREELGVEVIPFPEDEKFTIQVTRDSSVLGSYNNVSRIK